MALISALYAPRERTQQVADAARAMRLAQDLSRKSLAARSGVPEPTIKRFETTGRIAFESLVMLADALGTADQLQALFTAPAPVSLKQIKQGDRQRGRR
ncbi:helix-turn-helix domain-containing protein [Thermomonas sp.]